MKRNTLAGLGQLLPIGITGPGGSRHRDFVLKPYRMKEERAINAIQARNQSGKPVTFGRFVTQVLSVLCDRIAGVDLSSLKTEAERVLFFNNLYMGDVQYIWIHARLAALGPMELFHIKCGACRYMMEVTTDLSTLDVNEVGFNEKGEPQAVESDLFKDVTLSDGIMFQGELRKQIKLQAPKWGGFDAGDPNNYSDIMFSLIQNSIVGVEGIEQSEFAPLPDAVLDEMTKRDMEAISEAFNSEPPGPLMGVEIECPRCRTDNRAPIDWSYNHFFSSSSLPPAKK